MQYKVTFSLPIPPITVEAKDWRVRDGFAEFFNVTDDEGLVVGTSYNFEHILSIDPMPKMTTPVVPKLRRMIKPTVIPVLLDNQPLTSMAVMLDSPPVTDGILPDFDSAEPF